MRSTNHPHYRAFLALLKEARKASGTTQVALAEKLGNRQVFVSKLEGGDRRMDVIDLYAYCKAARIDFATFTAALQTHLDALPRGRERKLAIRKRKARPSRKSG